MILKDQLNRELQITSTPTKIISLVPSQTELLVHMGLSDAIVGVTKFCIHPKNIRKQAQVVGGTKVVHYDRIKALNPDIIVCNKEENTKEIVETLEREYMVHVSDVASIQESLEMITQYGVIFDKREEATSLISTIIKEQDAFLDFTQDKPSKKVLYFIWRDPWMAAGSGTFIDHLLKVNGFQNAVGDVTRYPELLVTEITNNKDVDMIFLSSEPFPFSEKHIFELQKIAPHAKIVLVDGEYFSWYGSRLKDAFGYFKSLH